MMVTSLFLWWYTKGWARQSAKVAARSRMVLETFSVGTLVRTLFYPFRQISAGQVQGPLNAQMRALGDRLFSRIFGALVRSIFIFLGLGALLLSGLVGVIQLALWPLVPLLPVVGLVVMLTGWSF